MDPNINTGIGARNGNVEAHLLGFGGRVSLTYLITYLDSELKSVRFIVS